MGKAKKKIYKDIAINNKRCRCQITLNFKYTKGEPQPITINANKGDFFPRKKNKEKISEVEIKNSAGDWEPIKDECKECSDDNKPCHTYRPDGCVPQNDIYACKFVTNEGDIIGVEMNDIQARNTNLD